MNNCKSHFAAPLTKRESADLFENQRIDFEEYKYIAGVDEAGRGPLAGPVVVASVILKPDAFHEALNDSKKLSEKKRDVLYDWVMDNSLAHSIEIIPAKTIDELNILGATMYGMETCVKNLQIKPNIVLFDGNITPIDYRATKLLPDMRVDYDCLAVVKGDAKYANIAAASILAKVTRDRIMMELDKVYPQYGFKDHKGYPTKKHIEMIDRYGICEEHRKSFNVRR